MTITQLPLPVIARPFTLKRPAYKTKQVQNDQRRGYRRLVMHCKKIRKIYGRITGNQLPVPVPLS